MSLLRLGQSYYLSKFATSDGGSHVLEALRSINFSKYEISESSRNYLIGLIDRKVSSEFKNIILGLVKNRTIKIIMCGKEEKMPNYIPFIPMAVDGKVNFYLNIGYYASKNVNKDNGSIDVKDIDPRVLFTLLVHAFGQYKIYSNPSRITDIKLQDAIISSYKKIISKIINKIVSVNVLTAEEKLNFDLIIYAYICKVLLRKDDEVTKHILKNINNKISLNKDKVESAISVLEVNKIVDFESFVTELQSVSNSLKKVNAPLLLREYAISMKTSGVLSLDLVQIFVPLLMSVYVGSSGIFNDKFVEGVLDNRELDIVKSAMLKE